MSVRVFPDVETLSHAAAEEFAAEAERAIAARGRFVAALSGGSTPKWTYEVLATAPFRDRIAWKAVHIFWGDERCVPPDDPRSNFGMTRTALLNQALMPESNIHRIMGEKDPEQAAAAYDREIREFFGNSSPRFDLVFLGMGPDGHTASLFPGTDVLRESTRWAAPVRLEGQEVVRITLTLPILNQARRALFLVAGKDKASMLKEVLNGPPGRYPAQLIKAGEVMWLVDEAAAGEVREP